jgi:hypothetical protein
MLHTRLSFVSSAAFVLASVIALTAADSAVAAPRQAPGGASQESAPAVQLERDKDYGTAVAVTVKADAAAKAYIEERGWTIGRNGTPESGFLIFIGTGPIVEGKPADFHIRRAQAFEEAMLRAKQKLVQLLAAEVSTSLKFEYSQGTPPLDEIAKAESVTPSEPGALAKLNAILNHEIDKELEKRNIDPSLQSPEEKAKAEKAAQDAARTILSTTEFSDATTIVAEHAVSGLQAFRTFESVTSKGSGQIAVVAIHSRKTEELQRALLGLGSAPSGAPKQNVAQWAKEQGPSVLLYTHGVQVRTNEHGELVLVGFGQASPIGKSERHLAAATAQASVEAMKNLRRFMGSLVRSAQVDTMATRVKDFADDTSEFKNESQFRESITSVAESLKMPGAPAVFDWEFQHPQSDRVTVGAVHVWSVSEALAANDLRDRLRQASVPQGGDGISGKRGPSGTQPKQPAASGKSSAGQGAEGETP